MVITLSVWYTALRATTRLKIFQQNKNTNLDSVADKLQLPNRCLVLTQFGGHTKHISPKKSFCHGQQSVSHFEFTLSGLQAPVKPHNHEDACASEIFTQTNTCTNSATTTPCVSRIIHDHLLLVPRRACDNTTTDSFVGGRAKNLN